MHKHIQAIFEKEMDRKEFLGYIGAGFLAAIGVSGMIKALLHHGASSTSQQSRGAASGYGSSAYGGNPVKSSILGS
ncbi:MAG: hypothetical protein QG553_850 [Patescibacteria group bacterium]|nr:hypothetical protein [Patescibacteria group bacterium]